MRTEQRHQELGSELGIGQAAALGRIGQRADDLGADGLPDHADQSLIQREADTSFNDLEREAEILL
ncbi:MAG TPA: hypothetical protein VEB60_00300, partial [Candidatus Paceibacterota bacterium]|nr:hypothetical protein [Candidatus Paceibacterota bacterium]